MTCYGGLAHSVVGEAVAGIGFALYSCSCFAFLVVDFVWLACVFVLRYSLVHVCHAANYAVNLTRPRSKVYLKRSLQYNVNLTFKRGDGKFSA